ARAVRGEGRVPPAGAVTRALRARRAPRRPRAPQAEARGRRALCAGAQAAAAASPPSDRARHRQRRCRQTRRHHRDHHALSARARASTPSAAARLVVPDLAELVQRLDRARSSLERGTRRALERERQRLDRAHERLGRAPRLLLERRRARLNEAAAKLTALSPRATLERGYAIVRANEGIVRSGTEVSPGDAVDVELAEGGF